MPNEWAEKMTNFKAQVSNEFQTPDFKESQEAVFLTLWSLDFICHLEFEL
jgi:hypothetical protein